MRSIHRVDIRCIPPLLKALTQRCPRIRDEACKDPKPVQQESGAPVEGAIGVRVAGDSEPCF